MSFLNDIYDIGLSPIRGIAGFAEGLYDFADFVAFDALPDAPDNFGIGTSKTIAGGFIEEGVKFALGFAPGVGVAGKIGQATGLSAKVAQASKAAQITARAGKAVGVGAAVDFTLYDAHEERLSNLIQKVPALANPISEYLAADDDDGEIEGRLKNVLEGGILGGVADSVIAGVRALKRGRKTVSLGGTKQEAEAAILEAIDERPEAFDNMAVPEIRGKIETDPADALDIRDAENIEKGADAAIKILTGKKVKPTDKPGDLGINIPRSSDIAANQKVIKTLALNVQDVYREAQKNPKKLLDIETDSEKNIQGKIDQMILTGEAAGEGGYLQFVKALKEEAQSNTAKLTEVQANIIATERLAQSGMEALRDIAKKAKGGSDEDKARFLKAFNEVGAMWKAIQNESMATGRLLTSRRIVRRDSKLLPSDYISREIDFKDKKSIDRIIEEAGGGNKDQGTKIIDQQIDDILDAERPEDFYRRVNDNQNFGVRLLTDYYMSTILSGPTTHLVNAVSNTLTALYLPAERALGSFVTGNTKLAKQELSVYGNMLSSVSDAFKAMGHSFKTGDTHLGNTVRDDRQANALLQVETLRQNPDAPIHQHLASYAASAVSASSRGLAAADGFFKTLTYNARVKTLLTGEGQARGLEGEELATFVATRSEKVIGDGQFYTYQNVRRKAEEMALKETKDPEELGKLINENMDLLWDESLSPLAEAALGHAEYATFTRSLTDPDRGVLASASGGLQRWINDWPLLRLVFPFIRTPVNLMTFAGERVFTKPFSAAKEYKNLIDMPETARTQRQIMEEYRNPDKRADAVGRTIMGYGIMLTAFTAAVNGNVSGGGPTDVEQRRVLEASGWQPYSIKVGDKWVSYRRFDPFSTLIGLIADYTEAETSDDGRNRTMLENVGASLALAIARNMTNKSYLTGAIRTANVLAEPNRYAESFVQQQAAAFVPFSSLGGQTNQALDPNMREIRTVLDALSSKVPGMSQSLDPRRNVLGEVIKRPNTPAGFLPFSYTEVKDDVILNEFAQLGHGFSPPKAETNGIDLTEYTGENGRSAYDRWLQLHGEVRVSGRTLRQELRRTIKSAQYQRLSPESQDSFDSPRVSALRRIVGKYRREAYRQMLGEFPEIRDLDQQNTTIKQFRAKGLTDSQIQSIINF